MGPGPVRKLRRRDKNLLTLLGIEPQFFGHPGRTLATTPNELSLLSHWQHNYTHSITLHVARNRHILHELTFKLQQHSRRSILHNAFSV